MKVDDLLQHIRLELPGVMDLIISQAIVNTAMDFCTRTLVWDEVQDPILLVDNISQYDMDAPSGARVLTIGKVWMATHELRAITLHELPQYLPAWQSATDPVPRFYNAAHDWRAITVYPTPLGANGALLTLRAQYAPKVTATTLPDFLPERFLDALLSGARARLMSQAGVPWENQPLAAYHKGLYEGAIVDARITQIHDRVPSGLTVQPRRFF